MLGTDLVHDGQAEQNGVLRSPEAKHQGIPNRLDLFALPRLQQPADRRAEFARQIGRLFVAMHLRESGKSGQVGKQKGVISH